MEFIRTLIDLFLHFDVHLAAFVAQYGVLVYGLLFAIVFAETGLIVTPFLPGDSLLFAAGALAATGALDVRLVVGLLLVAAIAGDAVNYSTGRYLGPRVFRRDARSGFVQRALNREHLERAHAFFEHHGGKAVVLARFVPIIRTFVPFVAGAGAMRYQTFAFYNVAGALLWVLGCVGAGVVFGNVPIVKENFSLVVLGIVAVSLIPVVLEWVRHTKKSQRGEPLP
jgi:membrane-associated protein